MRSYIISFILGLIVGAVALAMYFRSKFVKDIQKQQEAEFNKWFSLTSLRIKKDHIPAFSKAIQKISPSFCNIYGEAAAAEAGELYQVCGIGYRKSLEFLIKDYAIYENPSNKTAIENSFLGNCIKQHISDHSIQNSAELAAWLGNDESHYTRKYADKDVSDLKKLIHLTVLMIDSAENKKLIDSHVEKYRQEMTGTSGTT